MKTCYFFIQITRGPTSFLTVLFKNLLTSTNCLLNSYPPPWSLVLFEKSLKTFKRAPTPGPAPTRQGAARKSGRGISSFRGFGPVYEAKTT